MTYPTSRKYARTLAQAFPKDYAEAVTHYPRTTMRIRGVVLAIAIGVALAVLIARSI